MTRGCGKPGRRRFRALWLLLTATAVVTVCCTPARQVTFRAKGPPPWTLAASEYASFDSSAIAAEALRLQALYDSAATRREEGQPDTSLLRRDLLTRIFELSIHGNNPRPDYHRACALATLLRSSYPDSVPYYRNWERALSDLASTIDQRDSLERAVEGSSKNDQAQRSTAWRSKHALDSLSAVVKEQQKIIDRQRATLDGLKKVEMRMEEQRRKVQ